MLPLFRRIKSALRNMEPATIREIIIVLVILIISIVLSVPQFLADMEALRRWEQVHRNTGSYTDPVGN